MKKKGLVLAGGGVKGSYQIGAYYAFKKLRIKFNGIVGTSIGAFNAAALVSKNDKKLYNMWKTVDPGELLGIDPEIVKFANLGRINYKTFLGFLNTTKKVLKNRGFSNYDLKELIRKLVNVDKIKKSKMDFGLATLNISKVKPIYIFKEDMSKEDFIDYIMASCSLPVFKLEKDIDNDYYIDGGFFDNCPSKMLIDKGYKKIYEVRINGIGIIKKNKNPDVEIITIKPSRSNGSIFEMNHRKIVDNIYMGYYDTLKTLKKYEGFEYTFYKPLFINYKKMLKDVDRDLIEHYKKKFKTENEKDLIYKVLERVMKKEYYLYNDVYKLKDIINKLPNKNKKSYKFVKSLRMPRFLLYNS